MYHILYKAFLDKTHKCTTINDKGPNDNLIYVCVCVWIRPINKSAQSSQWELTVPVVMHATLYKFIENSLNE